MAKEFTIEELKKFIFAPSNSYFSGNTKFEDHPERAGFFEIVAKEGEWEYRDSFVGHIRSRGMEVVRYKGQPVWTSAYGGGMTKGQEGLADQTFEFLKQAVQSKSENSDSFRGPEIFKNGNWIYSYRQEGDVEEFNGYEEIQYNGQVVFFHKIIGGTVLNSDSVFRNERR